MLSTEGYAYSRDALLQDFITPACEECIDVVECPRLSMSGVRGSVMKGVCANSCHAQDSACATVWAAANANASLANCEASCFVVHTPCRSQGSLLRTVIPEAQGEVVDWASAGELHYVRRTRTSPGPAVLRTRGTAGSLPPVRPVSLCVVLACRRRVRVARAMLC